MAETKLDIVIAVKNQASAAIAAIGKSLSQVGSAAGAGLSRIGSIATSMPAKLLAAAGATASLAGAMGLLKSSVEKSSEFEGIQTSFITLLGSADAAQKRMEELAKFAASTPFDIPGVARASSTLETLTRGALSTGAGLTLVGDVAAARGVQFEEMAVTIGRAYDGLTSGRAVGEALQRLQEIGAVSGDTRGKIEQMQAAGQKGAAVWNVLAESLGRFGGEMQRKSGTFAGLMSNMVDSWESLQRAFGQPVMDALKPLLADLTVWFEKLKPMAVEFGQTVAGAITKVRESFADGTLWNKVGQTLTAVFDTAVGYLGNKLLETFKMAAATLYAGIAAAGDQIGEVLSGGSMSQDGFGKAFQREAEKAAKFLEPDGPPAGLAAWGDQLKGQLESIWGKMPVPDVKAGDDGKKAAQAQSAAAKQGEDAFGKIAKPDVDSLAKVGLFAGASAPVVDYSRRTAIATEKMAVNIAKLASNLTGQSPTATFA